MSNLLASERLDLIRNKYRPTVRDYIPLIFDDFFELHGDRYYGDDGAIIGGIGYFKGAPVTILAQVKGRNLEENKASNFAMPHPEGYRKALRLAKQAEKFHRPVICLIDTPGAFCGIEAEERGQGEAIARNIMEFMTLKTPVISIVLGEMLAQAGAVALLSLPENKGKIGLFGGINNCKFRQQVVPGDTLTLEVEIIKVRGPLGVGKGLATVNGKKAVSAEITFAIK